MYFYQVILDPHDCEDFEELCRRPEGQEDPLVNGIGPKNSAANLSIRRRAILRWIVFIFCFREL